MPVPPRLCTLRWGPAIRKNRTRGNPSERRKKRRLRSVRNSSKRMYGSMFTRALLPVAGGCRRSRESTHLCLGAVPGELQEGLLETGREDLDVARPGIRGQQGSDSLVGVRAGEHDRLTAPLGATHPREALERLEIDIWQRRTNRARAHHRLDLGGGPVG